LPDGQQYNTGPMHGLLWSRLGGAPPAGMKLPAALGIGKGNTYRLWADNSVQTQVAYHRYLFQVAYSDLLLGRLLRRLEETGMADRALVIVAADHGISFRSEHPKRFLTDLNALDLLHIPMFVKLPGQREGRTSARRVSGLDILPTIAEAIGLSPPWPGEGQSMIGPKFADPPKIRIATRGSGVLSFDPEAVGGSSRLPWQLETFRVAVPMEHVAAKGPYMGLIGRRAVDIPQADAEHELRVETSWFDLFEKQAQKPWPLPVVLDGTIDGAAPGSPPLQLAVSVNGVIVATTATTLVGKDPARMLAIVPPASFAEDGNVAALYHIHGEGPASRAGERALSLHFLAGDPSAHR
jgi:hypothetical protein